MLRPVSSHVSLHRANLRVSWPLAGTSLFYFLSRLPTGRSVLASGQDEGDRSRIGSRSLQGSRILIRSGKSRLVRSAQGRRAALFPGLTNTMSAFISEHLGLIQVKLNRIDTKSWSFPDSVTFTVQSNNSAKRCRLVEASIRVFRKLRHRRVYSTSVIPTWVGKLSGRAQLPQFAPDHPHAVGKTSSPWQSSSLTIL